jgi:hypothetical protein
MRAWTATSRSAFATRPAWPSASPTACSGIAKTRKKSRSTPLRASRRFRWLGELTFLDDTEFDPEPIQLSFDDIERHGPGVIVDFRHPGAGQFIAWVEQEWHAL